MKHLDIDRVLAVLSGGGTEAEAEHVEDCGSCRQELSLWQRRVCDLRELERNALEPGELHSLAVMFRVHGPVSAGQSWVARLVGGSEPAVAAVRGGLTSTFGAYRAGPFQILIQVRPSRDEGRYDVQGQVVHENGDAPAGGTAVVLGEDGHADQTVLDTYGEFGFAGLPAGACRLRWLLGDDRIDLETLAVGDEVDGSEG